MAQPRSGGQQGQVRSASTSPYGTQYGTGGIGPQPQTPPSLPSPTYGTTQMPERPSSPVGSSMSDPFGGVTPPWDASQTGTWDTDESRRAFKSYLENWGFPAANLTQNAYQWQNEFGENQFLNREALRWGQEMDEYGMGITGRQTDLAEWTAGEQARQWNENQGFVKEQWRDDLGLRNTSEARLREQMEGQLGTDVSRVGIERGQLGVNKQLAGVEQGRLGVQQTDADTRRQLANIQGAYSRGEIDQDEKRRLDEQAQYQSTESRLSTQNEAMNAIEMARIQQQLQIANVQAYGRAQAPNARWLSNF